MFEPFSCSSPPLSCPSLIMPIEEEPEPNPPTTDHLLDWLDSSISFIPSFIDDPYSADEINSYQWWDQDQDLVNASSISCITSLPSPPPAQPDSSKKRKQPSNLTPKTPNQRRQRNHVETMSGNDDNSNNNDNGEEHETVRKPVTAAKKSTKANGNHSHHSSSGSKDARWAEQLLNPCSSAISAGNLSRVQHLLYVLHELASPSGDANHRLAAHGLRALTNHLSNTVSIPGVAIASLPTFTSTEPRLFQNSIIKFHELSPWFSFPNSIANASILQTLSTLDTNHHSPNNLQIIDVGVSHGIQWPTLLESLTHRHGGPPPLVRLTVVTSAGTPTSFSTAPPGDDYPSRLLRFAKRINLNLQINLIENQPLQNLNPQALGITTRDEETLIICTQFRLHQLPHEDPNDRTEFLQRIRDMEPDLVVLTENEGDCSCSSCGDFATGFPRRVEFLWKFLDSTSAAFKGRECEERRVMEGEAATALLNSAEMNEGKVRWCERMRGLGFVGEGFGEEAMEGGKALLRKYDSNWEMRVEERGHGCICLCWKGQTVSFCSLWKLPREKG